MDGLTFVQNNMFHEDDLSCFTADATVPRSNVSALAVRKWFFCACLSCLH